MAMEKHFIQEGVIRSEIENLLKEEVNRAGYSSVTIQKTPLSTRIILFVEKPPIVIGKRGRRIKTITQILQDKFGIENPIIDVQKIENPTLDPNIVARRIAVALERGMHRRRVAFKALRAVMGSGARGVEIVLSGKLVGKGGRSRVEKYGEGYMKKAGDSLKLVKIGETQAYIKAGVVGVTVKIVPPNTKFPDQISVIKKEDLVIPEPIEEKTKKKKKKTTKKTKKKTAKKSPAKKPEDEKKTDTPETKKIESEQKEEKPKLEESTNEKNKKEQTHKEEKQEEPSKENLKEESIKEEEKE